MSLKFGRWKEQGMLGEQILLERLEPMSQRGHGGERGVSQIQVDAATTS